MRIESSYLPDFGTGYIDPTLSRTEKEAIRLDREKKMDLALQFLSNFPNHPRTVERVWCKAPCDNDLCNLISYVANRPLSLLRSGFCCFVPRKSEDEKRPIPLRTAVTLENTREHFERNVCGVCCCAPTVIISTPFISTPGIAIFLGILTGLVITTVAGTNTYVFSGDIGIVKDEESLIVQGGIGIACLNIIRDAYEGLAEHLKQKWESASFDERVDIEDQCKKILANWHHIFHEIREFGIPKDTVESILTPFSKVLSEILPNGLQANAPEYFEISII